MTDTKADKLRRFETEALLEAARKYAEEQLKLGRQPTNLQIRIDKETNQVIVTEF